MSTSKPITAIVAMNHDRVIGKNGDLPWHYSEDLKRFKRKTIDATVIMGRRTWESIGSKPLPRRRNIVISTNPVTNAECYTSIETAIDQIDDDIWIIGGGLIYNSALKYCDAVDVTWVPEKIEGENLVRFAELDPDLWQAGELVVNENDPRLTHQLFTRKVFTNKIFTHKGHHTD